MSKTIQAVNNPNIQFIVDDDDYEYLMGFRWRSMLGYGADSLRGLMHRRIMGKLFNIDGLQIDHKNGLPWDNRKSNLRVCTGSQNFANRTKQENNTSGFKGVVKDKKSWGSRIRHNGKNLHLGNFATPEEAAVAYDIKAKELYGEFALLNIELSSLDLLTRVINRLKSAKQRSGCKSKYKGVYFYNRWKAVLKLGGKSIHLGYFSTEEEAAMAYDAASLARRPGSKLNFQSSNV